MKKTDVLFALENFRKSYLTLKEAGETAVSSLEKDGTIQRFEFTFEMFWKTLKIVLEFHGIEVSSPRAAIKEAFINSLIKGDDIYLDMLEDRNRSSHIYDKETSEKIFDNIKKFYIPAFSEFISLLEKKI